MSLTNDIPTKLRVPAQLALDAKSVVTTLSQLQTLGTNNNLAYTYYKGMEVLCSEDLGIYRWRPVKEGETGGTLPSNFTYPAGIVSEDGVVYSNIAYNFFKETTLTVENLTELIQINNVGEGVEIYKDSTIVGDTTQFNFRTVVQENQGTGESFLRDIQQTTDELKVRVKTLVSSTLLISSTDEEVTISLPDSATIPALYVNNLYIPTYQEWVNAGGDLILNPSFVYKGEGSLAKPFTDSINYTSTVAYTITANTAIQNALDAYVGSGTRLNPEKLRQQVIIQKNNSNYTFAGDFNYTSLNLLVEGYVVCTTTDWIVDMDNTSYFDATTSSLTIRVDDEGILQVNQSLGFRNSGNTSSTPPAFDTGRIIYLLGNGEILSTYNGASVLTRYLINSEGNFNDSNLHFQIKCRLIAIYQGVYLLKNFARIDFYNLIQSGEFSGSINTSLQAFRMTGGQVRFFEKGAIYLGSEATSRNYGITFEPENDGIGNFIFALNSAKVSGVSEACFVKLNDEEVGFSAFNSPSGSGFATHDIGTSDINNKLFENLGASLWNIDFKNNVFSQTGIDFTKVDLTQGNNVSTINFIGNNIVESLVIYNDRAAALLAGIPLYSAYLKTSGVAYPSTSGWVRDIVLPS